MMDYESEHRQAADAVRSRIDLKYLLGLELTDPGFDYSVLCEFRARLVRGDVVSLLLDHLLEMVKEKGLLKSGGKQRTDSTHILTAVQALSRLELVDKTLLHALNNLAVVMPLWLKGIVPMRADHSWQQHAGQGYDLYHFQIDWEAENATCPQGQTSASWVSGSDTKGNPRIDVMFNASVCAPFQARPLYTKSKRKRRKITIRPQEEATLLRRRTTLM